MIVNSFDPANDAIINPASLAPSIEGFPKNAAVCFGERMITELKEHYEPVQIDTMIACIEIPIYKINYKGKEIAVYCNTLGGPAAAGLLEEMISSSCGVLNRDIAAKSLIVPTAAYRDEGTSYHYAPPTEYIEVITAPRLSEILTELRLSHICGKTWTTDAVYRETRSNMEKRKRDGCLTVEMECASIMAVAQFRGVDAYQFLYAADNLDDIEWEARTLGSLPQSQREQYLRIALEVVVRV
jgi:uridine phosphorylase